MDITVIVLRNVFVSLVSSILGLLLAKYLEKLGLVRKQSLYWYFSLIIILPVIFSIIKPNAQWWLYIIATLITSTLGYHRFELWYSFRLGRWWWLKEK
jgi:hypothetical protein